MNDDKSIWLTRHSTLKYNPKEIHMSALTDLAVDFDNRVRVHTLRAERFSKTSADGQASALLAKSYAAAAQRIRETAGR